MAYSKGGKVQFADLNTFSSTFNAIWGIGSGNQGYGQTSTINTVSYGQKVRATNFWNTLVTNIQAIANHNGASIAPMTPSPTTAGKITFLNNISSNLTAINNSRLNAVASGSTSVTTITSAQTWNDKMVVTINVTFESQNQARYYFNAGGQIGLSFSHPNTGSINTLISDICSEAGTIWISSPASGSVNISGTNYNGVTKIGGVASGRSTVNSNFGFYAFNTTAVQIFNQTGDTSPAAYQSTFLGVVAYTNNAGVLTFVVTFDEVPDGLTVSSGTIINVTLRPPSIANISNSWGTPTVVSTLTYSTLLQADVLVVAGGGGGGGAPPDRVGGGGSGGGGGGFQAFNLVLSAPSYTIIIGAGGIGGYAYNPPNGTNGSESFIIRNDNSSTISSGGGAGGGGGYTPNGGYYQGGNGGFPNGSAGGGARTPGGSNGIGAGGGAGGIDDGPLGGYGFYPEFKGGDGPIWFGNGNRYSGGGAGSTDHNNMGYGGAGGGGQSGADVQNGTSGTINTGGGGGAAGQSATGGSGGSGVVIIRYSGPPKASGGIITSSGGYTYHTFTSSGTLTT